MMKWAMLAAMALSVAGALMSGAAVAKGAVWYIVTTKSGFDTGGLNDCRPAGNGITSKSPQDEVRLWQSLRQTLGGPRVRVEVSKYPEGFVVDVIGEPGGSPGDSRRFYSNYAICEQIRGPALEAKRLEVQAKEAERQAKNQAELSSVPKN